MVLGSHSSARARLIAEIGQAHEGSLGTAQAYIKAAAWAGADAVKFQAHIASAESHPSEPWRVHFSTQDASRYDYWSRMEFTSEQWRDLYELSKESGLEFSCSPFSLEAVRLLRDTGIDIWKVASGEVTNLPLLEEISLDKKPVLLSSGMSTVAELERAISILSSQGSEVTLLHCTSKYPCPPEETYLENIPFLKNRLGIPVGYSDHSGKIFASLKAATLGAVAIEVHIVFHRMSFGPDVSSSVTIEELASIREGLDFIHRSESQTKTKDEIASGLVEMRELFGRSLVTTQNLPRGHLLSPDDLTAKKPGTGIPADQLSSVIGRPLRQDLAENTILQESDLGWAN